MSSAFLYVRVSSKEQEKEGYSLDAQEKLGEEYARRNNLSITKRWKVSESAWKEERDAFNQMIDYAKKHDEIKHIIFDVADRMTRNDMDKLKIYTLIKLHDKTIHFSRSNKTINKNSGSEDEFMLDIEVAVAKKMSNDISRKTKMGMLEKAEQGLFPSYAPIGYKNNILTKLLEIDKEAAPHIQRAFSLMASGSYSLAMIANILYKDGLRSKKGKRVGKSGIFSILGNPVYYGAFRWDKKLYQGSHEPIIPKETFDNAQKALQGPLRPYATKHNFVFNNLITCGICRCRVLAEIKKHKHIYYHCTYSKGRHKEVGYIKENDLADRFKGPVKDVSLPTETMEWLKEALKEASKNTFNLQENRLTALQKQQVRINERLSRLYDMWLDKIIDEVAFKTKENEFKQELIEIKTQTDKAKSINPNFYEDGCKTLELSNRLYPLYLKANLQEKAKITRLIASNYVIDDVSLYATYKKPFSFFTKRASRLSWLPDEDSNLGPSGYDLTCVSARVGLSLHPKYLGWRV